MEKVLIMPNLEQDLVAFRCPFILDPNRVRRTYRGGLLLEKFRRYENPEDSWFPEDWVGSVSLSRLAEATNEGCSSVDYGGKKVLVKDLISQYPEAMLGAEHVARWGQDPSLLVKLLDSSTRLRIQVHPTRDQAKLLLDSCYGKTESWIILKTRQIDGNDPYLLLGFKEGVTRSKFEQAVMNQNTPELVDMLHKIRVQPGDVFFVESGVPHAIGPGVFMIELQEPSDHTIYVEASQGDVFAESSTNTLGLGWKKAFSCFNYEGLRLAEVLARWKKEPTCLEQGVWGKRHLLLGCSEASRFFRGYHLVVNESLQNDYGAFYIAIIVKGSGLFLNEYCALPVQAGDTVFVPGLVGSHVWQNKDRSDEPLEIITCHPPV
jgi:mannose-6-phosphate isomerase